MLVLILGTLAFLIYKLLKDNKAKSDISINPALPNEDKEGLKEFHPEILERMKEMQRFTPKNNSNLFCVHHPDEPGEAACAICDHYFCKVCIRPFKSLHFCREHLQLIMRHEWTEVLTLKTSTQNPEDGVRLY